MIRIPIRMSFYECAELHTIKYIIKTKTNITFKVTIYRSIQLKIDLLCMNIGLRLYP